MKTTLIHISDTHEPAVWESAGGLLDKRVFGLLNSRLCRGNRYNRELLRIGIERILKARPDAVIYTGDATSTGQSSEFRRAFELFQPLLDSGIPVIYTPGNHDAYVKNVSCRHALHEFFHDLSRGQWELEDLPRVLELGGLRLVPIHCAEPTPVVLSSGRMSRAVRDFLIAESDRKSSLPLVCIGHFPILEQHPLLGLRRRLFGAGPLAERIRDHRIALSLCGHVHKPYDLLDDQGRGETIAGSLTRYGTMTRIVYDSESGIFTHTRITLPEEETVR